MRIEQPFHAAWRARKYQNNSERRSRKQQEPRDSIGRSAAPNLSQDKRQRHEREKNTRSQMEDNRSFINDRRRWP
jgi:hypothetical protein